MNSIVSITSHKGGVGKTIVAQNLGVTLSRSGHNVLLIDGDPQGNLSMSIGMKKQCEAGLYQVLQNKAKLEDVVVKAKKLPLSMVHLGIDSPQGIFNLSHGTKIHQLKELMHLTRSLASNYDITIIDTANNVGSLNTILLGCSDSVIIPVTCKSSSLRSLPLLLKLLTRIQGRLNNKLSLLGLVLPMLDVSNPYEIEVLSVLRETLPKGAFFSTFIPFTNLVEKAETKEAPVSLLAGAETLQEAYNKFSLEVIQRLEYTIKGENDDHHPEEIF